MYAFCQLPLFPFLGTDGAEDNFKAPPLAHSLEKVLEYVEQDFHTDSSLAFGMHPNAEIGFRTMLSDQTLDAMMSFGHFGAGLDLVEPNTYAAAESKLQEILEQLK